MELKMISTKLKVEMDATEVEQAIVHFIERQGVNIPSDARVCREPDGRVIVDFDAVHGV